MPSSEYVSNRPRAAFAMELPEVGWPTLPRVSVNENWPFWLFVHVGHADTLISSLSF